jgi:D-amino-acid dehydrogenase
MRLIVVGSGIVGTACAYVASGLGAEVTLIDGGLPGQATAAGAGIICPWSSRVDDPDWYAFGCAAAREYPLLVAGLADLGEADVSYRQVGALVITDSEEQREQTRQRILDQRGAAPEIGEVQALTGEEARRLFPPLRPVAGAVHIAGAARVDGRRLAAALTSAARRRGAVTRTGQAQLACRSGRAVGVVVDGSELIEADAVVAATGAWTTAFLQSAGVAVQITPERGQIAHISLGSTDTSRWPVILPSGSGHYLVAFDDSRVVAGATREPDAGFDFRVTPDGLAEVLAEALSVAPGLGSGTYLETRVGFRPAGPGIRPLLGPVPGIDGLVVATGLGATGLTMGPYAGGIAARLAMGIQPGLDLTPFDPLRP